MEEGRRSWTLLISPMGLVIKSELVFVNAETQPSGPAILPGYLLLR